MMSALHVMCIELEEIVTGLYATLFANTIAYCGSTFSLLCQFYGRFVAYLS